MFKNSISRFVVSAVRQHRARFLCQIKETQSMMQDFRKVFSVLDQCGDVLEQSLSDLIPPRIMILGDFDSGKTALLQQITKIPVLLKEKSSSSRFSCLIRIRNSKKSVCVTSYADSLEDILHCRGSSAKSIADTVKNQCPALVVDVESPFLPHLDIIEHPDCSETTIRENLCFDLDDPKTIYVLVVSANNCPHSSAGYKFISRNGLQHRSIGVLTMCDEIPDRKVNDLRNLLQLQSDKKAHLFADLIPHGWIAVSNRSDPCTNDVTHLSTIQAAEVSFFKNNMPDALSSGRATVTILVSRLRHMYELIALREWAPLALDRLDQALLAANSQGRSLPPLSDEDMHRGVQTRDRAIAALSSALLSRYSELAEGANSILAKHMRELTEIVRPGSNARLKPALEAERHDNERQAIERACQECAEALERHWVNGVEVVVRLAGSSQGVPPGVVESVYLRFRAIMTGERQEAVEEALRLVSSFYDMSNLAWRFKVKLTLQCAPTFLELDRDVETLIERLAYQLLRRGAPVRRLVKELPAVVDGWDVSRAAYRAALEGRQRELQAARRALADRRVELLGAEAGVASAATDIGSWGGLAEGLAVLAAVQALMLMLVALLVP